MPDDEFTDEGSPADDPAKPVPPASGQGPPGRMVMFLTVLAVIFFAALTVWAFQSVGIYDAPRGEAANGVADGHGGDSGRAV